MNKSQIPNELLEKLTLSKENILKVLYNCRVTEGTKHPMTFSFYSPTSSRKAPEMVFDYDKLTEYGQYIAYLFNQIYPVHNRQKTFSPGEGILDFSGKKWTDDNKALFALYYLSTASGNIARFEDGAKSAFTKLPLVSLPTYPANHPNFDVNQARFALSSLGYSLPDGQTHVD